VPHVYPCKQTWSCPSRLRILFTPQSNSKVVTIGSGTRRGAFQSIGERFRSIHALPSRVFRILDGCYPHVVSLRPANDSPYEMCLSDITVSKDRKTPKVSLLLAPPPFPFPRVLTGGPLLPADQLLLVTYNARYDISQSVCLSSQCAMTPADRTDALSDCR
jgi:hypothetical protein